MNALLEIVIASLFSGLVGAVIGAIVALRNSKKDIENRQETYNKSNLIDSLKRDIKVLEETIPQLDRLQDTASDLRDSIDDEFDKVINGNKNFGPLKNQITDINTVFFETYGLWHWIHPYFEKPGGKFALEFRKLEKRLENIHTTTHGEIIGAWSFFHHDIELAESPTIKKLEKQSRSVENALDDLTDFIDDFNVLLHHYRSELIRELKQQS